MKRWFCVLVPVLVLSSLVVWRVDQKRAENAGQAEQKAARANMPAIVSFAPVQVRDISRVFEATGFVEAPLDVKIAPKITGRIDSLTAREGDRVKKGLVLVRIDSSDVEAQVQSQMASVAEAQYRLAQAQMNQTPTDVAVNTQIKQQNAGVASAEADYNQARKSLDAQIAAASANVTDAQSKIDNAKAAVTAAQANLDNAKVRYNRIYGLYQKGYIAAQEVDDAKAAVSVQESALEITQGQIRSATAQKESAQQQLNIVKSKGDADIAAVHARLAQSKASLEYARANTSSKSAYRQSIAALKAAVAAAQAGLQSAKSKRQDTVLVSPLDGVVTGRYSDPGAIASPTQPILAVQFVKQVWVSVPVPEEVYSKLHIGQPVSLRLDAYPGKNYTASIIQLNPSADPQSRQFTVRVIMSNQQNLFKPGMFAHVSFETDRANKVLVVPRESIQKDNSGSYVVVADKGNKAKRVPVTPGVEDDAYICIGDALRPGQKVVSMCSTPIRDGQMLITGGGKGGFGGKPGSGRRGGFGGRAK